MTTLESRSDTWAGAHEETLAERALPLAGMCGAVGGAIVGATLGAQTVGVFPAVCGAVGVVLGSVLTAAGWYAIARVLTGDDGHARDLAEAGRSINSASRAE